MKKKRAAGDLICLISNYWNPLKLLPKTFTGSLLLLTKAFWYYLANYWLMLSLLFLSFPHWRSKNGLKKISIVPLDISFLLINTFSDFLLKLLSALFDEIAELGLYR